MAKYCFASRSFTKTVKFRNSRCRPSAIISAYQVAIQHGFAFDMIFFGFETKTIHEKGSRSQNMVGYLLIQSTHNVKWCLKYIDINRNISKVLIFKHLS